MGEVLEEEVGNLKGKWLLLPLVEGGAEEGAEGEAEGGAEGEVEEVVEEVVEEEVEEAVEGEGGVEEVGKGSGEVEKLSLLRNFYWRFSICCEIFEKIFPILLYILT